MKWGWSTYGRQQGFPDIGGAEMPTITLMVCRRDDFKLSREDVLANFPAGPFLSEEFQDTHQIRRGGVLASDWWGKSFGARSNRSSASSLSGYSELRVHCASRGICSSREFLGVVPNSRFQIRL